MTLEEYFRQGLDTNAIDYAIRVSVDSSGTVSFYIYPHNKDGETLDFIVQGNILTQKQETPPLPEA